MPWVNKIEKAIDNPTTTPAPAGGVLVGNLRELAADQAKAGHIGWGYASGNWRDKIRGLQDVGFSRQQAEHFYKLATKAKPR